MESCIGPIYHERNLILFQKTPVKGVWRLCSTLEQWLQMNCLLISFPVLETKCISLT